MCTLIGAFWWACQICNNLYIKTPHPAITHPTVPKYNMNKCASELHCEKMPFRVRMHNRVQHGSKAKKVDWAKTIAAQKQVLVARQCALADRHHALHRTGFRDTRRPRGRGPAVALPCSTTCAR